MKARKINKRGFYNGVFYINKINNYIYTTKGRIVYLLDSRGEWKKSFISKTDNSYPFTKIKSSIINKFIGKGYTSSEILDILQENS